MSTANAPEANYFTVDGVAANTGTVAVNAGNASGIEGLTPS